MLGSHYEELDQISAPYKEIFKNKFSRLELNFERILITGRYKTRFTTQDKRLKLVLENTQLEIKQQPPSFSGINYTSRLRNSFQANSCCRSQLANISIKFSNNPV
jgi:hypothetical protein